MSADATLEVLPEPPLNRALVTVAIMLATTMTMLDVTIANVALPHMAGSVSASADQITWVLTSYIVASAIVTPMSGWLAGRLGRRQVFIISIIGFTCASALCGSAQTLGQIVLYRVLQGISGAAMIPLSQSLMIDIYPLEQRGRAMSLWSMGAMVAPIFGPVVGGWLTDNFSWRSVFLINVPIGVMALIGVSLFLPREKTDRGLKFDMLGFALLSVAVAAIQLCLDRGQSRDWFESREIVIEASVAGVAFLLFFFHTLTAEEPFLPLAIFKDRNYVGATALGFACGVVVLSVLALLPTLMQDLLGYPVTVSGIVSAPRGVAMVFTMLIAGRLVREMDPRLMIFVGLAAVAYGYYQMSGFSLQMDYGPPVWSGVVMGLATGFIFLPTSILAFSTLDPALRSSAAGANALFRNLGNSIGISVMEMTLTRRSAQAQSHLSEAIHTDNPILQIAHSGFNLASPLSIARLAGEIGRQASMVAYTELFRAMAWLTLLSALLLLAIRPPRMSRA